MTRTVLFLALVSTSMIPASSAASAAPQRWALLIGVDDYIDPTVADLKYCGADQRALFDKLIAAGFPEEHVFILDDKATENRYRPIKSNIETQLKLVSSLAKPGDLLVLSFSGHGVYTNDKSYLCPADAKPDDPDSLISRDEIYNKLQDCGASLKLMLVDACRNHLAQGPRAFKPTAESRAFSRDLSEARLPEGVLLLHSCATGELSWEDDKLGHGVFMHFLLTGMDGDADGNHDGKVTLAELAEYAGDQTHLYVVKIKNAEQRPFLRGDLTTEALRFSFGKRTEVITNSIGAEMVLIPAAEFDMGNEDSVDELMRLFPYATKDWFKDATQRHHVRITKPFMLGKYEVTIRQFRQFVSELGYVTEAEKKDEKGGWGYDSKTMTFFQNKRFNWKSTGFEPPPTDDDPVVNVTWNDTVQFCNWLSRNEKRSQYYTINGTDVSVNGGNGYRLPSEAEWEYACRAGTTTRYSCGNNPEGLTVVGNTWDASAKTKIPDGKNFLTGNDGYCFTAPVGRFTANRFGLHDMHGNVAEWCGDWWSADYYATSSTSDPQGAPSGAYRVLRGGSWYNRAAYCRSAFRYRFAPDYRYYNLGFRLATVPPNE